MKRIYVDEQWCLGCHLCEYYCAFSNSGEDDMVHALKNKKIYSRITVEEREDVSFAVSCRHCTDPLCVKGCLTGALSVENGVIAIDKEKCISCYTCIALCPFGSVLPDKEGIIEKCELCIARDGNPLCVEHCPNNAIVFKEGVE